MKADIEIPQPGEWGVVDELTQILFS